MKRLTLAVAMVLAGCSLPDSGVKVIVGAKLIAAPGREPIEYSVVVIEGGKITAAGPQASTPVPKGSAITRGMGMTIEPESGGDAIEVGRAANLVLKGAGERKMHNGDWLAGK
jgi:hypothetical protein